MASRPEDWPRSANIADYAHTRYTRIVVGTARCDKCNKNRRVVLYRCQDTTCYGKHICDECVREGRAGIEHAILRNIGDPSLAQPTLEEPEKNPPKEKKTKVNAERLYPKKENESKKAKGKGKMGPLRPAIPDIVETSEPRRRKRIIVSEDSNTESDEVQEAFPPKVPVVPPRKKRKPNAPSLAEIPPTSGRLLRSTRGTSMQLLPGLDESTHHMKPRISPEKTAQEVAQRFREDLSVGSRDISQETRSNIKKEELSNPQVPVAELGEDRRGLSFLTRAAEMVERSSMNADDQTRSRDMRSPSTLLPDEPRTKSTIDYSDAQSRSAPKHSGPRKDIEALQYTQDEYRSDRVQSVLSQPDRPQPQVALTYSEYGRLGPSQHHQESPARDSVVLRLPGAPELRDNIHRSTLEPYRSEHEGGRGWQSTATQSRKMYYEKPTLLSEVGYPDAQPQGQAYTQAPRLASFTPINAGQSGSTSRRYHFAGNAPAVEAATSATPKMMQNLAVFDSRSYRPKPDSSRLLTTNQNSPAPASRVAMILDAPAPSRPEMIHRSAGFVHGDSASEAGELDRRIAGETLQLLQREEATPETGDPSEVSLRITKHTPVAKRLKALKRSAILIRDQDGTYRSVDGKRYNGKGKRVDVDGRRIYVKGKRSRVKRKGVNMR